MISGMMKINRNFYILSIFLSAMALPTISIAENNDLMRVLEDLASVKQSTSEFTEIKEYGFLNEKIKLTGQLKYIAPETLIKKTIYPKAESFKVTGNELMIQQADGTEHKLLLTNYPVIEVFIEAYRGVLSGNLRKLNNYYRLEYVATGTSWKIKLTPIDNDALEYIEIIIVEGVGSNINKVTTIESGGDKSVLTIKNTESIK